MSQTTPLGIYTTIGLLETESALQFVCVKFSKRAPSEPVRFLLFQVRFIYFLEMNAFFQFFVGEEERNQSTGSLDHRGTL